MTWYWKVRIYRRDDSYYIAQIVTLPDLFEIVIIKDFYEDMTGCKMLLESMSEESFNIYSIRDAFTACWE